MRQKELTDHQTPVGEGQQKNAMHAVQMLLVTVVVTGIASRDAADSDGVSSTLTGLRFARLG
jgi:hypothetical protein